MDWKLIAGIAFLIVGLLMFNDVRKRRPASDATNWKGKLMPQYIQFWISAIMAMIVGLIFIFTSI
jgi:hypothetical protein